MENVIWTNKNILEIEHVSKKYQMDKVRVTALDSISLCVNPNEFFVVLSPSRNSKITLHNLIGAWDMASSGDVSISRHIRHHDHAAFTIHRFRVLRRGANCRSHTNTQYLDSQELLSATIERSDEPLQPSVISAKFRHVWSELHAYQLHKEVLA